MSQNAALIPENEECGNSLSRSKLLHKATKKSKKRSRPETVDPDVPQLKSKKHRRQHVDGCHVSHYQSTCANTLCDADPTSDGTVPEPLRKKRPKDDVLHVASDKGPGAQARNKQRVGSKGKPGNQPQGRFEPEVNAENVHFSTHEKPAFHVSSDFEVRDSTMIPISPDLQPISTYQSPDPAASPPLSARSRYSSDTSHSSYSRSSLRHSSTRRHHHEPEPSRTFHHRRMEDPRPRFSHRAYAGYRRVSHGRDTSPDEWSEDFSFRHRRGRSRGSPRSGHGNMSHSYGYRHSDSRQRYDSSPRSSAPRRYESRRSRSRSASSKRDRRHYETSDRPHPRARHYPQRLSPSAYSRHKPIDKRRDSREPAYDGSSKHRSSKCEPSHASETKHTTDEDRSHSYKPFTKRAGPPSVEERRRHGVERSRSKSPVKDSKYDRPRSRSRSDPDHGRPGPRRSPIRISDGKRRKSVSHSPPAISSDKARKTKISPKVSAVIELLGELTAETISDAELESILPPDILCVGVPDLGPLRSNITSISEIKPEVSDAQHADTYQQPASASEPEKEHVNTPDALDNLCSRIRQKLNEPEPWDSAELFSADGDEADVEHAPEETLALEHSLVNMAAANKNHSSLSQQVIADLSTQWQELIESTEKNLTSVGLETDFVSPAVRVTDILKPIQPDFKLLPIQKRSRGAVVLQHIGVSHRYLGSELLACLNSELQSMLADGDANDEEPGATPPESSTPLLTSTEIAWMQRSRITSATTNPSYLNSLLPFGTILSASSDLFVRQQLLEAIG